MVSNLAILAGMGGFDIPDLPRGLGIAIEELPKPTDIEFNACQYMKDCVTRKAVGREYCYMSRCENCQTWKFYQMGGR